MKNLSLTVKIWLAISLVSLSLYLVVLLITPSLIRNFFSNTLMEPPPPPQRNITQEPSIPFFNIRGFNIRSVIILEDGTTIPSNARHAFPPPLLDQIRQNALNQQSSRQLYESTNGPVNIRYVIRKDQAYGHSLYQVSFLRKSEEEHFIRTLLFRIMLYAGIALIISWFAALIIVRYLTRPIIQMEHHVKRIASRDWHEGLNIPQKDEIGQLAGSIETMRQQLVRQDEAQQSMLQNISHELKTPIMVIRSYARAIQDGVYPKGDLSGSLQVIDEEGERLEKLVKQLLYLTRLDYLATREPLREEIQLDKLIEKVIQRVNLQRPELTWRVELQPVNCKGDEETLRAMIENLLDNHLRHAVTSIEITLRTNGEETEIILCIWNDGARIEPHILIQMFQPFHKGREGKFGLGLTIVQRIVKMYQGHISLNNERDGVSSTIKIPFRHS